LYWALYLTLPLTLIAAWFTHVITCIQNESWLFLIGGALCFPVGFVHGVGIWFGYF
jgi:hypothetical protein